MGCTFDDPEGGVGRDWFAAAPSGELGIVEFARERLGFEADLVQAEVLRSEAKRGLLNCSRQWGKSTVAAIKGIYRAVTRAGCLVVIASPTERQSAEFMSKAQGLVRGMGEKARGDGKNTISILFENGSRMVGLSSTERTIRGFSSVSLMVIDEAARVPDDVYKALRPMLAVAGGDLWMLSTPAAQNGFFYEAWTNEGDVWERVTVQATDCLRIGKEFLEEERRQLGAAWFRKEYMCEFVEGSRQMLSRDVVRRAVVDLKGWSFA
jgi:Terminase large subunit, T4likevirus-type, N-terminal